MASVRVGHFGARMYYGVPRALQAIGMLEKLYTDFSVNKGLPALLSSFKPFQKIKNRRILNIPSSKIRHLYDFGFRHALKMRNANTEHAVNTLNFEHGRALERQMMADGLKGIDGVAMVGSSSQFIFALAQDKGIKTIGEQIIAPGGTYLEILDKYLKPYQTWETIKTTRDSLHFWQDVSLKEWTHTDFLLCGSEFVKESVMRFGVSAEKLRVIPYGVPLLQNDPPVKEYDGKRKLKVLFVGSVCLRKGIQYLLEIAAEISSFCEIKICGKIELTDVIVDQYKSYVSFEGHVSRENIGFYYEWADVFVLPTLFEGSATVCYEAIQYALPIITTKNSGVFLSDGEGVSIIPEGDKGALRQTLIKYYEYPEMISSASGMLKEKLAYASFEGYSARLQSFFLDSMNEK